MLPLHPDTHQTSMDINQGKILYQRLWKHFRLKNRVMNRLQLNGIVEALHKNILMIYRLQVIVEFRQKIIMFPPVVSFFRWLNLIPTESVWDLNRV